MKHKMCPQCGIANFYLKDNLGNRLVVKISREGKITPKDSNSNINDYNTDIIYCLGCSWYGPISKLI